MSVDKVRVALLNCQSKVNIRMPLPPLGLSCLIEYYKIYGKFKEQVEFKVFDENAENKDLSCEIIKYEPSIIGVSSLSFTKISTERRVKFLKEKIPNALFVAGGIHYQVVPGDGMQEGLYDIQCVGEGEEAFRQILDEYWFGERTEKILLKIPNILWKNKEGCIISSAIKHTLDISDVPPPNYDYFNKRYYLAYRQIIPRLFGRFACVLTSRGCPYACTFCFNSFCNKKVRYYSIDKIIELMYELRHKYSVRVFSIVDDIFLLNRERVDYFCTQFKNKLPDARWTCSARASLFKPNDLQFFEKIKQSGCIQISFGLETGNDTLLKKIKGDDSSVEKNENAIKLAHKAGIKVFGYFMCGIPGETKEQMDDTANFIKKNINYLDHAEIFIYTPYPGSILYNEVKKMGLLENITADQLSTNNLLEGDVLTFNPLVPHTEIIKFRNQTKQLIINKYTLLDKMTWFMINMLDNPLRTLKRIASFYKN